MNTAQYSTTKTASGGEGKYPLSTETLDFIQGQIRLLQYLSGIGGGYYIMQGPSKRGGMVALQNAVTGNMEVVELALNPTYSASIKWVVVSTRHEDITADGENFKEARTIRTAKFSTAKSTNPADENYPISQFLDVSGGLDFPTNRKLATQINNMPATVLEYLKDTLAEKLTSRTLKGVTKEQVDGLRTPCLLSCTQSVALFGLSEYSLLVTAQGNNRVRQELIQGNDQHYVRTLAGGAWSEWTHQTETAMHLDVKVVKNTVYIRHGALADDCNIVLLRKKRRGSWRRTGGDHAYTKNKGIKKRRSPKKQYVHFKGIILSKGEPGKWYVPKCVEVKDRAHDGNLIGKEMPTLCSSLFYVGTGGYYRLQGSRKRMKLKGVNVTKQGDKKGEQHAGYCRIGVQIARLKNSGGKDAGGEIVRMKYRVSQKALISGAGPNRKITGYTWDRSFSVD